MSKMKRTFAVLLTLAMVLGMSAVTFADEKQTTITITGVDAVSTVTYEQIIVPDQKEPTGWKFESNDAAASFKTAVTNAAGNSGKTDQQIIAGLIKYNNSTNGDKLPDDLKNSAAQIDADLLTVAFNTAALSKDATLNGENFEITAKDAGVYVIHATDVAKKEDTSNPEKVTTWITYNPMAAYVSFGYTNGVVTSLDPVTVTAKQDNFSLTKEDNEADKVTAVGDVVEYTIKTSVPYIPDEVTPENAQFKIVDSMKGAQYVDSSVNTGAAPAGVTPAVSEVKVMVKLGEGDAVEMTATIKEAPTGYETSFELDLSDIAKAVNSTTGRRENANQTLEITYKAYVTGTVIDNNAYMNIKNSNDGALVKGPEDDDKIYTGTLQITKKNADSKNDTDKTLANAKFVLYYTLNGTTYYAVTGKTGDAYTVTGWTETKPSGDDNLLITGTGGIAVVKGIEDDTDREYFFEEVEAPEGYSINKTPAGITEWKDGKRNEAASANDRVGYSEISDTQLSSLPSTGGIGTTIFTIVGCLIMIAAAGLFFASRRKSEK